MFSESLGVLADNNSPAGAQKVENQAVQSPGMASNLGDVSAIELLPPELLCYILETLLSTSEHHYAELGVLRLVCKRWQQLIDTTPSFWCIIHQTDPLPLTLIALERSANYPLCISGAARSTDSDALRAFVSLLAGAMGRWGEVTLDMYERDAMIYELLINPAPSLERFHLSLWLPLLLPPPPIAATDWDPNAPMDLFSGEAPKLRIFKILGPLTIKWNSNIFHSLTHLEIFMIHIDMVELMSILSSCTTLQDLSLGSIAPGRQRAFPDKVTMPNLRRLHLYDILASYAMTLFDSIHCPQCLNFDYEPANVTNFGEFSWKLFLECAFKALPSVYLEGLPIHVEENPDAMTLGISFGVSTTVHYFRALMRTTPRTDFSEVLFWVCDLFNYLSLSIAPGKSSFVTSMSTAPCMKLSPYVTKLILKQSHFLDIPLMLQHLSQPSYTGDQWLCPNMTCLQIFATAVRLELVLAMVHARYGDDADTNGTPVAKRPAPLKELHLRVAVDRSPEEVQREINRLPIPLVLWH